MRTKEEDRYVTIEPSLCECMCEAEKRANFITNECVGRQLMVCGSFWAFSCATLAAWRFFVHFLRTWIDAHPPPGTAIPFTIPFTIPSTILFTIPFTILFTVSSAVPFTSRISTSFRKLSTQLTFIHADYAIGRLLVKFWRLEHHGPGRISRLFGYEYHATRHDHRGELIYRSVVRIRVQCITQIPVGSNRKSISNWPLAFAYFAHYPTHYMLLLYVAQCSRASNIQPLNNAALSTQISSCLAGSAANRSETLRSETLRSETLSIEVSKRNGRNKENTN